MRLPAKLTCATALIFLTFARPNSGATTMTVPIRKEWQDMKKKYGVADGAAKGINLGAELDKYWKGIGGGDRKKYLQQLELLHPILEKYIKTVPEAKVAKGKFGAFKAEFLKNYVNAVAGDIQGFKEQSGDLGAFTKRLSTFLDKVEALPDDADLATLQNFRSGDIRGMMATATVVKGFDGRIIDHLWKPFDDAINKLSATDSPAELKKIVKLMHTAATLTRTEATKGGLKF
jgi:hypothetical protein